MYSRRVTCIVAVRDKRGVVLAGDSCGGDHDWARSVYRDRKVFRSGPYALGYTDSFRMGQLLEFKLELPTPPKREADLRRFMVTEFAEHVRMAEKAGGYSRVENNTEGGGKFIVVVRARIFLFDRDFAVLEPAEPFFAVGCGEKFALGALRALPRSMPAKKRCTIALQVAERSSAGVSPPFHYVQSGRTLGG